MAVEFNPNKQTPNKPPKANGGQGNDRQEESTSQPIQDTGSANSYQYIVFLNNIRLIFDYIKKTRDSIEKLRESFMPSKDEEKADDEKKLEEANKQAQVEAKEAEQIMEELMNLIAGAMNGNVNPKALTASIQNISSKLSMVCAKLENISSKLARIDASNLNGKALKDYNNLVASVEEAKTNLYGVNSALKSKENGSVA